MNRDSKLIFEAYVNNSTKPTGPFSLYWKNEETEREEKWYTANTLKDLLRQINQDNLSGVFEHGMVNEDREFSNVKELFDYVNWSDFFITDGRDNIIAGSSNVPERWEDPKDRYGDEDAEEKRRPEIGNLTGTIRFGPYAVGSKSEGIRPYLYPDGTGYNEDEKVIIYYKGDDEYTNQTLKPFNNKRVSVTGEIYFHKNQPSKMSVSEIKPVPPLEYHQK
jgi:hypothetical protein